MKIATKKIKLFGQVCTVFQVIDANGNVLQLANTMAEAEAWIAGQK